MVRGLAAMTVCVGHLRAFFLVDFTQTGGGIATTIFYLLTGLHHEAVMLFFVLSGFLVGGSVIRLRRRGAWRWSDYLVRRLSRLWVVIVPALLLTLGWDLLGLRLDPAGYHGAYHAMLMSGPGQVLHNAPRTFFGNLLFLQGIRVPAFGSNGPLWSLANEFWYYLLFPLGLQAVLRGTTPVARIVAFGLVVAIWLLLPAKVLALGAIWLFGVGAFLLHDKPATARIVARWPVGIAALLVMAIGLAASRIQTRIDLDYIVGAAFAAALPWLARAPAASALYRRVGFALSEMSYTLYLVHFPLLAWIYFSFVAPRQWTPGAGSLATLAALLGAVMLYAAGIWWLFERNTARVRATVARLMRRPGAGRGGMSIGREVRAKGATARS